MLASRTNLTCLTIDMATRTSTTIVAARLAMWSKLPSSAQAAAVAGQTSVDAHAQPSTHPVSS